MLVCFVCRFRDVEINEKHACVRQVLFGIWRKCDEKTFQRRPAAVYLRLSPFRKTVDVQKRPCCGEECEMTAAINRSWIGKRGGLISIERCREMRTEHLQTWSRVAAKFVPPLWIRKGNRRKPGNGTRSLGCRIKDFRKIVKSPALIHVVRTIGIAKEITKNWVPVLFEHGSSVYGRLIAYKTTLADLR